MSKSRPSPSSTYSIGQKAAHWLIVLLCIAEFPTASAMRRTHHVNPFGLRPDATDLLLHKVHAWSGWAILLLVALLLMLRFSRGAPGLPPDMPRMARALARLNLVGLHGTILFLVVTGTIAAYYSARLFSPAHIVATYVGLALALLHVMAALWHLIVRRDDLVFRMLPSRWARREEHVESGSRFDIKNN